ncbi:Zinc finger CCCH domain-containing protein 50 [Monoraphidium neglectum]|uniref:Zinc finger CCCH domain-containing protein 50 n=1 Tax=Monoraphidium neglectum TaxID=145388 RepID=A0A0D2ME80_9CHLO|nr:Zinc finger CCCH domain-containing protein 50 [Monoraphidium neglectum]KIY99041.1 Zinc finger CCCH domain-containing protein 50 [Monoraphidium neglectum]|eukprot:XP_013898061.1 Zinc finger CCCH domain-containing protein 50 [Monoraphidium neglectum]
MADDRGALLSDDRDTKGGDLKKSSKKGHTPASPASTEIRSSELAPDFMMNVYKLKTCPRSSSHDWRTCPYAHMGENAARRDHAKHLSVSCPDSKAKRVCPRGASCPFAHSMPEYFLHPSRYRTQLCNDGNKCSRPICFFAHDAGELRTPHYPSLNAEQLEALFAARAALSAQSEEELEATLRIPAPSSGGGILPGASGTMPPALLAPASYPAAVLAGEMTDATHDMYLNLLCQQQQQLLLQQALLQQQAAALSLFQQQPRHAGGGACDAPHPSKDQPCPGPRVAAPGHTSKQDSSDAQLLGRAGQGLGGHMALLGGGGIGGAPAGLACLPVPVVPYLPQPLPQPSGHAFSNAGVSRGFDDLFFPSVSSAPGCGGGGGAGSSAGGYSGSAMMMPPLSSDDMALLAAAASAAAMNPGSAPQDLLGPEGPMLLWAQAAAAQMVAAAPGLDSRLAPPQSAAPGNSCIQ